MDYMNAGLKNTVGQARFKESPTYESLVKMTDD